MIAVPGFPAQIDERLLFLARKMLRQYPLVRRWEQTDDVLQEASLRLHRALQSVTPESELHLHRLAALQVRRVLLNLAAKYASPFSFPANYDTGFEERRNQYADDGHTIGRRDSMGLERWTEFHRVAGTLPSAQQDVFDLLWYGGMNQDDAAKLLGLTKRTVQRRWREARLTLVEGLDGEFPS